MEKGFLVGAIAGAGFWASNQFVPTTKSEIADQLINVAVAGVVGMLAGKLLHRG